LGSIKIGVVALVTFKKEQVGAMIVVHLLVLATYLNLKTGFSAILTPLFPTTTINQHYFLVS
jgi:hypothetical protein